ncbi:uncharacterized protein UBRO2_03191 [Ustilago bromivora]|uniref:Retrotransposon gag domain-containing protein n=1 Tax=Ustilago bromivora TaxID=307758 RepID=A0A8H8TSV7_9BASI|nr:uncharacterized protein UBRO2_03191 [Ustilago bromivora]
MVDVGVFCSVGEGISATHFIRAFNRYLFENCTNQDDEHSAKLFLSFQDGHTEKWVEAQPNDVKNSWKALKPAFLARFQLDETSVESPQEWDKWLRCLLELSMDVLSEMVTQWGLAHAAWMSLSSELQTAIPQPKKGVIEFINTCKSVPWSTYECILDEHDQREEVIKEIRHRKQHDMEIHWELKNKLQCDLATSIEEQVHKALDSLHFQMMPVSLPMQQGQLSPPQMHQLPAPPVHQPLTPPCNIAQFTEITQQTFLDTPQEAMNVTTVGRTTIVRSLALMEQSFSLSKTTAELMELPPTKLIWEMLKALEQL